MNHLHECVCLLFVVHILQFCNEVFICLFVKIHTCYDYSIRIVQICVHERSLKGLR